MDFNIKMFIFIAILALLVWVNYKHKNVIVRLYNYMSQFPKVFLVGIGLIAIFAPMLLKNNSILDSARGFLPGEMNEKIDKINGYREMIQNTRQQNNPARFGNSNYIMRQPLNVMRQQNIIRPNNSMPKIKRNVSEQVKKRVAASQQWKCYSCGTLLDATYEVDHQKALVDKGGNDLANLRALCPNCHRKKTMEDDIKRKYPGGKIY